MSSTPSSSSNPSSPSLSSPSSSSVEDRVASLERQNILLWSALGVSLGFFLLSRRRFVGREVIAERFLLVDQAKAFGTKKIMAEFRPIGQDRVLLRMKKGTISILNSRNQPAIILDSELNNANNNNNNKDGPQSKDNEYLRTLQGLEKQPVVILKDHDDLFTVLAAESKIKGESRQ